MQCNWTPARASTPHIGHPQSSMPPVMFQEEIPGHAPPMAGAQVPEPSLNMVWADSPPTIVVGNGGNDSFESAMQHITVNIGHCRIAHNEELEMGSHGTLAPVSLLGEMCPHALTEMSVLHYEDDTVIIM